MGTSVHAMKLPYDEIIITIIINLFSISNRFVQYHISIPISKYLQLRITGFMDNVHRPEL
jgi:hypothetical protein